MLCIQIVTPCYKKQTYSGECQDFCEVELADGNGAATVALWGQPAVSAQEEDLSPSF